MKETDTMKKLMRQYLKEVVSRHGVPVLIISDRDDCYDVTPSDTYSVQAPSGGVTEGRGLKDSRPPPTMADVPCVLVTYRSIDIANMIVDQSFAQLYDDDAVSLCCLGILQLVILGVESRRVVPDWMNANVKHWSPLYVAQPTNEDDAKTYSIFGYTWDQTWILESFRVTALGILIVQWYPRVAAWRKKKGKGGLSSFQGHVNSSYFNTGTSPEFPNPNAVPTWCHPIWVGQICKLLLRRIMTLMAYLTRIFRIEKKREQFPSKYKLTPFMKQPPTTILPKQRVNKTKNKGNKANLSPLNLGGAFEDDNVEENNVTFLDS
ncbi:hypothetical protein Tco_0110300 [Tanacetum coccineum]